MITDRMWEYLHQLCLQQRINVKLVERTKKINPFPSNLSITKWVKLLNEQFSKEEIQRGFFRESWNLFIEWLLRRRLNSAEKSGHVSWAAWSTVVQWGHERLRGVLNSANGWLAGIANEADEFPVCWAADSEADTPVQLEVAEEEKASSKQEVSANKWTYPLTPRHFQLEMTPASPWPHHCRMFFSLCPFVFHSFPFDGTGSKWFMCIITLFFKKKT